MILLWDCEISLVKPPSKLLIDLLKWSNHGLLVSELGLNLLNLLLQFTFFLSLLRYTVVWKIVELKLVPLILIQILDKFHGNDIPLSSLMTCLTSRDEAWKLHADLLHVSNGLCLGYSIGFNTFQLNYFLYQLSYLRVLTCYEWSFLVQLLVLTAESYWTSRDQVLKLPLGLSLLQIHVEPYLVLHRII